MSDRKSSYNSEITLPGGRDELAVRIGWTKTGSVPGKEAPTLSRDPSLFEDMDEHKYPVNRTGWDRWTHNFFAFFLIKFPEEGNSFMYNYHQKVEIPDRDYDGGCGYIWIYMVTFQ